eukprot:CAMPEP_0118888366 /NCGR_PEP_ID=MMETSP1163-20130328/25679_1 /TAXON_ID=124430 /ORGANISM="Phaeomonas parva, Strain CCMP2877" /LENGTH=361 /DNA_ID=CAMNT_0006826929 /DNA_START=514 /DNA_END=1599 /DNA_ORIENTATION=-
MAAARANNPGILMVPGNAAITNEAMGAMALANHRPGLPFDAESLRPGVHLEAGGGGRLARSNTLQTKVIRNPAHVRKESVALVPHDSGTGVALTFEVDATQPTQVDVFLAAQESSDLEERIIQVSTLPEAPVTEPLRGPVFVETGLRHRVVMPGPPLSRRDLKGLSQVTAQAPKHPTADGPRRVVTAHAVIVQLSPAPHAALRFGVAAGAPPGEGAPKEVEEFTFVDLRLPQGADGEKEDEGEAPEKSYASALKVRGQKILARGAMYALRQLYGTGEDADADECVICMTDPKEFAVLPCGHFCLCSSCHASLLQPRSKCPICRNPVAAFLKLGNPRIRAAQTAAVSISQPTNDEEAEQMLE